MTSNIMHSCDESDDSLRITSVEVEVEWFSLGTLVSSTDKADHHDVAVEWFSLGTLVSSTDKADHHDVVVEWFSLGTLVSSTDKADHHDRTEILLKILM
jgi:hypothetical protein